MIYLDHNATAPIRPEVIEAVIGQLRQGGNASSIHGAGRQARRAIEAARETIARAIGLPSGGTLIFTGGATEANQFALQGIDGVTLLASAVEHEAVLAAGPLLIDVDAQGVVKLDALAAKLDAAAAPCLVSIMAANNETGVLQPLAAIAPLVHARGALLHVDAAQAVGRMPFDMTALGADLVSISAHKLGGPQGVGALAIAPGIDLRPLIKGGGQERGLRGGTENVAGIVGFATAIDLAVEEAAIWQFIAQLRDRMETRLRQILPEAILFGAEVPRLPNTSGIAMPGVKAETQIIALDLAGIAVSAGAACSSGKVRVSHVLRAMGVGDDIARTAIRVSLCRDTMENDVEAFIAAWSALALRQKSKRVA